VPSGPPVASVRLSRLVDYWFWRRY
jgi:hypothetical protein